MAACQNLLKLIQDAKLNALVNDYRKLDEDVQSNVDEFKEIEVRHKRVLDEVVDEVQDVVQDVDAALALTKRRRIEEGASVVENQ